MRTETRSFRRSPRVAAAAEAAQRFSLRCRGRFAPRTRTRREIQDSCPASPCRYTNAGQADRIGGESSVWPKGTVVGERHQVKTLPPRRQPSNPRGRFACGTRLHPQTRIRRIKYIRAGRCHWCQKKHPAQQAKRTQNRLPNTDTRPFSRSSARNTTLDTRRRA